MAKLAVMKGVPFTEKRLLQWLREDDFVIVQTKRDEIRVFVNVIMEGKDGLPDVYFTSASGKPLYNLDCFATDFIFLSNKYGIDVFDCGISVNESFEWTRKVVRSSKKPYDLKGCTFYPFINGGGETTLKGKFYFYDLPNLAASYEYRRIMMADMGREGEWFGIPETWVVPNAQGVHDVYDELVAKGFEGVMVKRLDFQYQPKRTTDWMKMKPEEEADGIITGYTPGQGKYAGMVGSVNVRFEDGSTTSVSGMTDAVRAAITAESDYYIGKVLEVRYMMRDSQGGYRHPRWYRLHPDKDEL